MENTTNERSTSKADASVGGARTARFERPTIEAVSLSCEISAYAPDGDDRPLF